MSHDIAFQCIIKKIIYQSSENHFTVLACEEIKNNTEHIVTGTLYKPYTDQTINITGKETNHPQYGKQISAQTIVPHIPQEADALFQFLSSGRIKGIGKETAKKIYTQTGKHFVTIFREKKFHFLSQIKGISKKTVEKIETSWKYHTEQIDIMLFLQAHGISPTYALKLYNKYKDQTIAVIKQNPYIITYHIWGIGFITADTIAQKMGIPGCDERRINAGIIYALSKHSEYGHVYCIEKQLIEDTHKLLHIHDKDLISTCIKNLCKKELLISIKHENEVLIGLYKDYMLEKKLAYTIQNHLKKKPLLTFPKQKNLSFKRLHELQLQAIKKSFLHTVSILTGGPGTGKTTTIKTLISLLKKDEKKYILTAPTGRAAKRLSEVTGAIAKTLHRLLEFSPEERVFKRNETNKLEGNIIIIDESSMIDMYMFNALISAVPETMHILLIGDIDQLPSISKGNVLHDLIYSNTIPYTKLTYTFRQKESLSDIVSTAHEINIGNIPSWSAHYKDIIFIKEQNSQNIPKHLTNIYKNILPSKHISTKKSIILTPMKKGFAGTKYINLFMQYLFQKQKSQNSKALYINDKIMQTKNNYTLNVFNGDIGYIKDIKTENNEIIITASYEDKEIIYKEEHKDELTLAYGITIHKSQGSEFDCIIIPIFMEHFIMLYKKLIYTALTRAKTLCIFIGQPKALACAIKTSKDGSRRTLLSFFLK